MGNSVWKSSIKTYLLHKLFRRDKECYLIGQYVHHLYKTDLLIVINQSTICGITALVELVSFWFRIIRCGWFFMLGIIASNFLKIGNGWAIVVKYAATVLYLGTHFFPQSLENSRSHSNAYNLIFSKKHAPIKWETDWRFYRNYAWYYQWPSELWEVWVVQGSRHKKESESEK